jgi:hypothetical protein
VNVTVRNSGCMEESGRILCSRDKIPDVDRDDFFLDAAGTVEKDVESD